MFDAKRYFANIDRVLSTAARAVLQNERFNRPTVHGNWDDWEVITWREVLEFNSGHTLEVSDNFSRRKRTFEARSFSYRLGDGDGSCVFQFDTHGIEVPMSEPCHLHVGGECLERGDPRLAALPLVGIDFLLVFRLTHRHLKGKKLPWE